MSTLLLGPILGTGIGLSLGMIGAGGSIIAVPALVYGADLSVHDATGTSLLVVGPLAMLGAVVQHRAGRVHVPAGLSLGLAGIGGAFLGVQVAQQVQGGVILVMLAFLMLLAALRLLMAPVPESSTMTLEISKVSRAMWAKILLAGLGLGLLTGFFGIGGGFIAVPILVIFLRFPMYLAIGTSLLVIFINSMAGIAAHAGAGQVDVRAALPFLAGGVVGSLVGTRLGGRISQRRLRGAFAALLIVVMPILLYKNLELFG